LGGHKLITDHFIANMKTSKVIQDITSEVRLLYNNSIRWLYTQTAKLHLNNTKTNETDVQKEWEDLQHKLKSAPQHESLGKTGR
jgi:hypothetical protein